MDSITQFVLGAAVGESIMGKHIGRKALLWGGLCGTIPDLDVFIPLGDPVSNFIYHRSFSHSLFVLAILTPLLATLATKLHQTPSNLANRSRWMLMIYAVFATHVLLDCFTAYGTQIFWPFYTTPVTLSTIFIIDPLYTLPLIIGVLMSWIVTHKRPKQNWSRYGLLISSAYLCWTVAIKLYTNEKFEHELTMQQDLEYSAMFTTPTPFNTLLWRAVVIMDTGYYEGFYSLFDGDTPIRFTWYPSDVSLMEHLRKIPAAQRLAWFSKGFYKISLHETSSETKNIRMTDLRMGVEPFYVFQFDVAEQSRLKLKEIPPLQLEPSRNFKGLSSIWRRIWSAETPIALSSPPIKKSK